MLKSIITAIYREWLWVEYLFLRLWDFFRSLFRKATGKKNEYLG